MMLLLLPMKPNRKYMSDFREETYFWTSVAHQTLTIEISIVSHHTVRSLRARRGCDVVDIDYIISCDKLDQHLTKETGR